MAFLTPDNIRIEHGLEIKEKIIPWGARWPKDSGKYKKGSRYKADRLLSNGTGEVEYITIHNTNDIKEAKGTNDAEQYARATWPNANMGSARVHFFIDEIDCWQQLQEYEVGWHAGDGNKGPGNDTSLSIEIIMDGSGSAADKSAEDRGALLAAILLNRHGLNINRMVPHKHWSGKNCPCYILPHWAAFQAKVEKYLRQIQGGTSAPAPAAKTIDEIAREVIQGKWGNNPERREKLTAAGYDYAAVQAKVNQLAGKPAVKAIDEIAREVIQGKWGNGAERKQKLTAAGYDYAAIQAKVNQLLK